MKMIQINWKVLNAYTNRLSLIKLLNPQIYTIFLNVFNHLYFMIMIYFIKNNIFYKKIMKIYEENQAVIGNIALIFDHILRS